MTRGWQSIVFTCSFGEGVGWIGLGMVEVGVDWIVLWVFEMRVVYLFGVGLVGMVSCGLVCAFCYRLVGFVVGCL